MDLNKPVSGREFARMVGQTEGAVRKAKNRGSISKGVDANGKFIPSIASEEWGKEILPEFKKPIKKVDVEIIKPTVKKEKKEPENFEEIVADIMHEKLPKANASDLDDDISDNDLEDTMSKIEAERITSILKAKILKIELNKRKGELVPIEKVNSVLFSALYSVTNASTVW